MPGDVNGFTPDPIDWARCDADPTAQCATLEVPLDWSEPTGDVVELALARRRATGKRIGAILTNPGGPGASGVDLALGSPFGRSLTSRFDIVGWDPRGVGESTSVECADGVPSFLRHDPDPDTDTEQKAIDNAARRVAEECGREAGPLLEHMGTDNVARDLDAIRLALGEKQLTYVGFSYGTMIGLRYLALFPTRVRAMVLDGVVDPTADLEGWLTQQTIALDASLKRALDSCGKPPECPVADLEATYDAVRAGVERSPLPAGGGKLLGPAELATGAIYVNYDQSAWPRLAEALSDAVAGDGTAMFELAQGYYDFGGFTAYAGVECVDAPHPVGPVAYAAFADRLEAISPRLGGSVANELLPCAFWPAPVSSIIGPVTGEGSPPILVLGNRGDALTPYENSTEVAETLSDGHLVSNDGEGHTSYGLNSCVDRVVHRYLIELEEYASSLPKSRDLQELFAGQVRLADRLLTRLFTLAKTTLPDEEEQEQTHQERTGASQSDLREDAA